MKNFFRALKLFVAFASLFFGCYLAYLIRTTPEMNDHDPLSPLMVIMVVSFAIGATILWMEWKKN